MKKLKALIALMMVMVGVVANTSVVHASETGVTVRAGEMTIRKMNVREMEAIISTTSMEFETMGEIAEPFQVSPASSYTPYEYSRTYEFYEDDLPIGEAEINCIVWHYTDGKVHLYRRTIDVATRASYTGSRTYGSIINTDGSLSYTLGDRVIIYDEIYTWRYAIDFRITPSDYSFSCYEV